MPRFKLLKGQHAEGPPGTTPTYYEVGAIIECDHDLVAMFGEEKFKRLSSGSKHNEEEEEELPPTVSTKVVEEPKLVATPKSHRKPTDKPEKKAKTVKSDLGDDVTEDFPLAKDNDLAVLKVAGKKSFNVVDRDVPNKQLNKGKLKEPTDVNTWLDTYLKT